MFQGQVELQRGWKGLDGGGYIQHKAVLQGNHSALIDHLGPFIESLVRFCEIIVHSLGVGVPAVAGGQHLKNYRNVNG